MGQPSRLFLGLAGGAGPGHLRGAWRRARRPGLPRSAARRGASKTLQKSLLLFLMAGALSTAARVSSPGTRSNSPCPHYSAVHEDEVHVLWDSSEWEQARETWCPRLTNAATTITHLGPPGRAGPSLEGGPLPLSVVAGVDRELLDEFLYSLYGLCLAVLVARMVASRRDQAGHGDSLFPDQARARSRNPYPRDGFIGPLPGDRARNQPHHRQVTLPGWQWLQDFV